MAKIISLLILTLFLSICANNVKAMKKDENNMVNIASTASIIVPGGVSVTRDNAMPDFSVYYAIAEQKVLLGIYVGNAPSFPNSEAVVVDVGGCEGRSITSLSAAGTQNRDILIHIRAEFPKYLHLFYRNLDEGHAAAAEDIIKSLSLVGGATCAVDVH